MFFLRKLLLTMLLPPFSIILLLLLAAVLYYFNCKYSAKLLALATLVLFYALSTPLVAHYLHSSLTASISTPQPDEYRQAELIVVLGGGIRESNVHNRENSVTALPLERMRYAAHLHQQTGLPILTTGGSASESDAEAEIMAQEFKQYFAIDVGWKETESSTTGENAKFTKQLLKAQSSELNRIILVTNDWHMRRAKYLFEQQGFEVLLAAVKRQTEQDAGVMSFIPQMASLMDSQIALKEWIGYFALRYTAVR